MAHMDRFTLNLTNFFLLFLLVHHCVGPPAKKQHQKEDASEKGEGEKEGGVGDLGLEYNRYLSEVVNALEADPEFRKKLETAEEADLRSGKIASELEYVNHHVRTKLDELKRIELQRLRELVRQAEEAEHNKIINPDHVNPQHIDHTNPHTFEAADLHKLITKVRQDLAEVDRKRREEFKEYELQKKFEQEQKLKAMDEEHKKKYMQELEEKKKHKKHEPLHHPGSRAQLEEVWEKEDHMENQKFNPKTFFLLHDINGDGYWDEEEVKALFVKELEKMQEDVPKEEFDMREKQEEMERMREHVFKEADLNGDRLLSYEEFLQQTKKQEFEKDEGWDTVDSEPQFTQQEYEEFERRRQEEIQRLIDQGLLQPHPGMMHPPPPGYPAHPGQFQQGYHPGAVGPNHIQPQQYGQNVGYHPQAVPQHGQAMPHQGISQHPQQAVPHPQQGMPQYAQHPQQGMPQHTQQGVPHQGMPQHPQQGIPQHPQQGIPQHPPQGAPQQHPAQAQYAPQGQYNGQQYYLNQGAGQPQGQVPVQGSNQPHQQNSAPQQNAVPLNQQVPLPQGQAQQPATNHQQNLNSNQGVPPPSQGVPPPNQGVPSPNQGIPPPNQGVPPPNQGVPPPNQGVPPPNQGVPHPNQANQQSPPPNQQYNQPQNPSQGAYGSQSAPQPPSYQQGNVNPNQIHSDFNKAQNNNTPKRRR